MVLLIFTRSYSRSAYSQRMQFNPLFCFIPRIVYYFSCVRVSGTFKGTIRLYVSDVPVEHVLTEPSDAYILIFVRSVLLVSPINPVSICGMRPSKKFPRRTPTGFPAPPLCSACQCPAWGHPLFAPGRLCRDIPDMQFERFNLLCIFCRGPVAYEAHGFADSETDSKNPVYEGTSGWPRHLQH